MKRFVLCTVLGGVAAIFVHASFYSFLVGLGIGFFFVWLPTKMSPGCDTDQKRNEWCWFGTVTIMVFAIVVFRPDHGWITKPSFVLRPSQALMRACQSRTGGLEDPNWVKGSARELGQCSGVAAAQGAGAVGRVLWAIAAWLRIANWAVAIFLTWLLLQLPSLLRQVRRRLRLRIT